MNGIIFDIERNSFVDGPGIRTTVFFKGCNLKCKWCHNPESQSMKKEFMFHRDKCTSCGKCVDLTVDNEDFICFNDAKKICGKTYTVDEVISVIEKDSAFYKNSGGGVTFSGGECMLQIDFLLELLKKCKEKGIHTAVDTAGNVPFESFEKIIPFNDLFLYDIKCIDSQKHKKYTDAENHIILENYGNLIEKGARIWVRIPIIPHFNDTEEEMEKVKEFFMAKGFPEKTELLPYHKMGEHKYEALGRKCAEFSVPQDEALEKLRKIIN